MSRASEGLYSPEAARQLGALAAGPDVELWDAVVDAVDAILDDTERQRALSPGLRDARGKPILATVVMYERDPRWFVFWGVREGEPVILGVGALPHLLP